MTDLQKKRFQAMRRIKHDGKPYEAGDHLWMTESDAEPLLELKAMTHDEGTAEPVDNTASNGAPPQDKPAKIIAAIGALQADSFGANGAPNVKVLEKVLGFQITARERDRAWKVLEAVNAAPEANLSLTLIVTDSGLADLTQAEFDAALALRPKGEAS